MHPVSPAYTVRRRHWVYFTRNKSFLRQRCCRRWLVMMNLLSTLPASSNISPPSNYRVIASNNRPPPTPRQSSPLAAERRETRYISINMLKRPRGNKQDIYRLRQIIYVMLCQYQFTHEKGKVLISSDDGIASL
jgi:hypothetical protein